MNKKKAAVIISFVGIFSISLLTGYEMDNIKSIINDKETTTYSDYNETTNNYDDIKGKDEDSDISIKEIKSYWYILKVNDNNYDDYMMVKLTVPEDKYENGDKVYYYKNVFENDYKVYSATYTYDDILLRNTGPNIVEVSKVYDYLDDKKDNYSLSELKNLLDNIKSRKKGLSKTYKSFN